MELKPPQRPRVGDVPAHHPLAPAAHLQGHLRVAGVALGVEAAVVEKAVGRPLLEGADGVALLCRAQHNGEEHRRGAGVPPFQQLGGQHGKAIAVVVPLGPGGLRVADGVVQVERAVLGLGDLFQETDNLLEGRSRRQRRAQVAALEKTAAQPRPLVASEPEPEAEEEVDGGHDGEKDSTGRGGRYQS